MSTPNRARPVLPPAEDDRILWAHGRIVETAMPARGGFAHPITQAMRPDLPVRGGEPPRGIVRSNLG